MRGVGRRAGVAAVKTQDWTCVYFITWFLVGPIFGALSIAWRSGVVLCYALAWIMLYTHIIHRPCSHSHPKTTSSSHRYRALWLKMFKSMDWLHTVCHLL
jgi:hypothetical protein